MVERHGLDSGEGGNVCWVRANLRDSKDTIAGAKKAVEWAGGTVDLLVNNAGIAQTDSFMETSPEDFDDTIAVNTRAPLLVSQVRCNPAREA